jgi:protoporphyrinogen oxidase
MWTVTAQRNGETRHIHADHIWSTIPITLLARFMAPSPDARVLAAANQIQFRQMALVYLQLDVDRFTSTDAHYFPESNVRITRLSEPKNYFGLAEPRGTTVLCAELPCSTDDDLWTMDDEALGRYVVADMARAGLPLARPPIAVHVRRLKQAYPVYLKGYEVPFGTLDDWAASTPNLLVYGRQGLFAHDNTHHALYMAYAATNCLNGSGTFDHAKWAEYRQIFATHVVED